jgi:hypothetical protein
MSHQVIKHLFGKSNYFGGYVDNPAVVLIDGIFADAIHNGVARLKTFRFSAGDQISTPAGGSGSIELCIRFCDKAGS